jgi:hypothetical protein
MQLAESAPYVSGTVQAEAGHAEHGKHVIDRCSRSAESRAASEEVTNLLQQPCTVIPHGHGRRTALKALQPGRSHLAPPSSLRST